MVALFDRFRKKPPRVEPRHAAQPHAGAGAEAKPTVRPNAERRIVGTIVGPHLTEKASGATARGWYTFRVRDGANKIVIKQAVEDRYGVKVERVRVGRQRPKEVRRGRVIGSSPGFKKAMVKVRAGQSIEFT